MADYASLVWTLTLKVRFGVVFRTQGLELKGLLLAGVDRAVGYRGWIFGAMLEISRSLDGRRRRTFKADFPSQSNPVCSLFGRASRR